MPDTALYHPRVFQGIPEVLAEAGAQFVRLPEPVYDSAPMHQVQLRANLVVRASCGGRGGG